MDRIWKVMLAATVGVFIYSGNKIKRLEEENATLADLVVDQRKTISSYERDNNLGVGNTLVFRWGITPSEPKLTEKEQACESFINDNPSKAYNLAAAMLQPCDEGCWGLRRTKDDLFLVAGAVEQCVSSFSRRENPEIYRDGSRIDVKDLSSRERIGLDHAHKHLDQAVEKTVRAYLLNGVVPRIKQPGNWM